MELVAALLICCQYHIISRTLEPPRPHNFAGKKDK